MMRLLSVVEPVGCEDCGAGPGVACTDACESALTLLIDRVEADLDGYSGPCCTGPWCPCRTAVA